MHNQLDKNSAQLAGAVEYTNSISAEGKTPINECPEYNTRLYDKEASVLYLWFGLVSLFNGISTFVGYLMPKPFS